MLIHVRARKMSTETYLYSFPRCVRGYHIYQDVWEPVTGEELKCVWEPANVVDRYAVSVVRNRDSNCDGFNFERFCACAQIGSMHKEPAIQYHYIHMVSVASIIACKLTLTLQLLLIIVHPSQPPFSFLFLHSVCEDTKQPTDESRRHGYPMVKGEVDYRVSEQNVLE